MIRKLLAAALLLSAPAATAVEPPAEGVLRVATYNVSMYRDRAGQLLEELETGDSLQARRVAEVLQRVRPDVVLLNEFDYMPIEKRGPNSNRGATLGEADSRLLTAFKKRFLEKSQSQLEPLIYPHVFCAPVNTGVDSGMDLDHDGQLGGPGDAWGYGAYPGQYGMLVLSRIPLGTNYRTYQNMKWRNLRDANWPVNPETGENFYSREQQDELRISSKSFWDVGVQLPPNQPGFRWRPLRLLCSHPTPPVFDGPEDRNGCRNFDEIRMISEYITGDLSKFPVDDNPYLSEGEGFDTLRESLDFVVLGDLNADPVDGSGRPGAIQQLLDHPAIDSSFVPTSEGGVAAAKRSPGLSRDQKGDPAHHTGNFNRDGYANLRVDYALPSKNLEVVGGGVFWPKPGEPGAEAIEASDHRLVWIDIRTKPPSGANAEQSPQSQE